MTNMSKPKPFNSLVVECLDCGFVYSAEHVLEDNGGYGGYDCPNCNEIKFKARLAEAERLLREARPYLITGIISGRRIAREIDAFLQEKPEPEKAENWDEEGEHDD